MSAMQLETQGIDVVMFRITSGKVPDELIRRVQAGVPVRLITDRGTVPKPDVLLALVQHRPHVGWRAFPSSGRTTPPIRTCIRNPWSSTAGTWPSSAPRTGRRRRRTRSASTTTSPARPGSSTGSPRSSCRKWNNLRIDGTPITPTMFQRLRAGLARDAGQRLTGERRARPGHVGVAPMGRRLVGAQVRRLLRHDQPSAARGAGLHARRGDRGRQLEQGIVQSLLTSGAVRLGLSVRACARTTYYWRIRGKTMLGDARRIQGPVWSFTTDDGTSPTVSLDKTSLQFGATTTGPTFVSQTGPQDGAADAERARHGDLDGDADATVDSRSRRRPGLAQPDLSSASSAVGGLPLRWQPRGAAQLNFTGAAIAVATVDVTLNLMATAVVPGPLRDASTRQLTFGRVSPAPSRLRGGRWTISRSRG